MKIEANGIRINYRIDGPEGGPWVTMSNSLATSHRMWDAQMAAFTGQYRVLRYDKRGHGETDVPPGPYSFELLADDVLALLDALHIARTHFVGLSMGGMTGMTMALRRPAVLPDAGPVRHHQQGPARRSRPVATAHRRRHRGGQHGGHGREHGGALSHAGDGGHPAGAGGRRPVHGARHADGGIHRVLPGDRQAQSDPPAPRDRDPHHGRRRGGRSRDHRGDGPHDPQGHRRLGAW